MNRDTTGTAAILGVFVVLTGYLYAVASDRADHAETRCIASIGQISELNARVDSSVFSIHHGVTTDFDELNSLIRNMELAVAHWQDQALQASQLEESDFQQLRRFVEQKTSAVERFKTQHSVMRNSVAIFLHLTRELRNLLGPSYHGEIIRLAELESSGLLFMFSAGDKDQEEFRQSLAFLDGIDPPSATVQSMMRLLHAHADVILSRTRLLNESIQFLHDVYPDHSLNDHHAKVCQWAEEKRSRAARFRFALFLSALGMVGFGAYKTLQVNKLMHALRLANEFLEQRVEQRTQKLQEQEAELRQKHKLEAIGALAGGVAHEFNNLLQVIRGYSSFAMDLLPQDKQPYQDLTRVVDATDQAARITGQLLGFSRRKAANKTTVDLNVIVKRTIEMARPLLHSGIDFQVELDPNERSVWADEDTISQILLDLYINGRDAMPDGGRLTVSTRAQKIDRQSNQMGDSMIRSLVPGDYCVVSVADGGCGISAENKQHIFEPFFTTKEVGKGTGMGLAFAYGAIQDHSGAIAVASTPGKGTCFDVYLPAGKAPSGGTSVPIACERSDESVTNQNVPHAEDNSDPWPPIRCCQPLDVF